MTRQLRARVREFMPRAFRHVSGHGKMVFDLHVAASEAVDHYRGWVKSEHSQDDWSEVAAGVEAH